MATIPRAAIAVVKICLLLISAINIAAADKRSVLAELYKQAAEQNRPLVLVVDNHSKNDDRGHQTSVAYKGNNQDSNQPIPINYMFPKSSLSSSKSGNNQVKNADKISNLLKFYLSHLQSQNKVHRGELKKKAGRSDDRDDVRNQHNRDYYRNNRDQRDVRDRYRERDIYVDVTQNQDERDRGLHDRDYYKNYRDQDNIRDRYRERDRNNDRDDRGRSRPVNSYYKPRENQDYNLYTRKQSIFKYILENRDRYDRDRYDRDRRDRDRRDRYRSEKVRDDRDRVDSYRIVKYRDDRYREDRYRSVIDRFDRDKANRYEQDGNRDRDSRDDRDNRDRYKLSRNKDRSTDNYDADVVKNLLRISNDLNCDAKYECKSSCQRIARMLRHNGHDNCEDLCDENYECEESHEVVENKIHYDDCDAHDASETCGDEKTSNISTRGYKDDNND